MAINWYLAFATALIPLVIGTIWYSKPLFGNAWMKASGVTEEQASSGNMILILGLAYLFGLFLSASMMSWSIHQFSTQSLFATQEGFSDQTGPYYAFFQNFMSQYGDLHRSFGHGAVHGGFAGIMIALPLIAINALFERRSWKYVAIHAGYWTVTLSLICGVLCAFA